jgi:hypothetical protein
MHKFWCGIAIFVLGGVLGTGFGVALGFFIFPFVPGARGVRAARGGTPHAAGRQGYIHSRQSVRPGALRQRQGERVRARGFLEPNFEVGPGPAFHVYLVPKASIRSSADIKDVLEPIHEVVESDESVVILLSA